MPTLSAAAKSELLPQPTPLPLDRLSQLPDDAECWRVRFDSPSEVFANYDDYWARWQQYRRRQWACAATGRQNLTFEEALVSEHKAREYVSRLSTPLQSAILRQVQYADAGRIDQLVDDIFAVLRDRYVAGEQVILKRGTSIVVTVVGCVGQENSLAAGPPPTQYTVRESLTAKPFTVDASTLGRQRNSFSKVLLRQYIRDSATHEFHSSATAPSPWIVNADLVAEFGLADLPLPAHLYVDPVTGKIKRREGPSAGEAALRHDSAKTRWPIEDTMVNSLSKNKPAVEMSATAVPPPSRDFLVSDDVMGDFITAWNFLFTFAQLLKLFPFSLDDFEAALRHSNPGLRSPLLDSIWTTLLECAAEKMEIVQSRDANKLINDRDMVDHTRRGSQMAFNNSDDNDGNDMKEELRQKVDIVDGMSVPEENLVVEQWWLWQPGQQPWEEIIPGFLLHTGNTYEIPNLVAIVEKLTASRVIVAALSGQVGLEKGTDWRSDPNADPIAAFYTLSLQDRLHILSFLISNGVTSSPRIRAHVDHCSNRIVDLKKEKRALEAQKRELLSSEQGSGNADSTKPLESANTGDFEQSDDDDDDDDDSTSLAGSVSSQMKNNSDMDVDQEEEDSTTKRIRDISRRLSEVSGDGSARISRQEKLRLQQTLREAEEEKRRSDEKIAREQAREKNIKLREQAESRRALDAGLEKLKKRENIIDNEIRRFTGGIQVRALGRDRFWNRYWWFDGYGTGTAGLLHSGSSTTSKASTNNLLAYATGRLFVEGAGRVPHLGHVSGVTGRQAGQRRVMTFRDPDYQRSHDPFVVIKDDGEKAVALAETGNNWLRAGEWAYYDTINQVDQLIAWLNPRGVREHNLKNALNKHYTQIEFSLQQRQDELQSLMNSDGEPHQPRHSTRLKTASSLPHMTYVNRWKSLSGPI